MGDANWYYKVLGLHCDGTNGSTTFTDVCGKTVTANGNAQISTAQYPSLTGKTSSAYFDGTGDYLSIPDSADWNFGSGDFTIRCRVRFAGYPVNNGGQYQMSLVAQDLSSSRAFYFGVVGTTSSITALNFYGAVSGGAVPTIVTENYAFSLNTWYLLEVCRVGNFVYLFVDGTLLNAGGTAYTTNHFDSTTTLKIGAIMYDATYPYYLNGYISEVEIYKGVGLHTASYTPSTAPFADEYVSISGTVKDSTGAFASRLVRVYRRDTGSLVGEVVSNESTGTYKVIAANSGTTTPLKHFAVCHDPSVFFLYRVLGLHCDGTNGSTTFTDVCGKTVTANGNAQISTAQYPALTGKTSSAYFDGSGDYLSIPDSANWDFGTGDFAVRIRARFSSHTTNQTLVGNYQDSTTGWALQRRSDTNTLRLTLGDTAAIDVSWTPSDGVWYLIEAMRIGTSLSIRVDGTQVGSSVTNSTNISGSANPLLIGALYAGSYIYFFDGYLSELEIIKGYVFSVSDYTPSTDPFVNSTPATENAIIYDDLTPT